MFKVGDEVWFTDLGSGSPRKSGQSVPQPIPATVARIREGGYTIQFHEPDIGWGENLWDVYKNEVSPSLGPNDVIEIDE